MNFCRKNGNYGIYGHFSSACSLILVIIFALASSILSFRPERVKVKDSCRPEFCNNYYFNSNSNGNERASRALSIGNLQAIGGIHHGDEVTSGGTTDLSDSNGLEWMKNVDSGNSDGPGSVYDSIVEYDVSRH